MRCENHMQSFIYALGTTKYTLKFQKVHKPTILEH